MSASIQPLISIVIPVFNVEPYLRECLDSVENQTLREIEIICVNDCSTDGSLAILREYETIDQRIIVIDKPLNEGLSTTRNVGMASATGKYLLFIDSDDFVDRDLCRKVYECAETNDADLVLYDYAGFWEASDLERTRKLTSSLSGIDPSDKIALLRLQYYAWTKLIRTDHASALGLRFPAGLLYEDAPVHWTLVTMTAKIALLPERLCFYRQRAGSIGYRTDWKRTDYVYVYDMIREFLVEHNLYERYREFFVYRELCNFYILYDTIAPEHQYGVLQLIMERLKKEHWYYVQSGKDLDLSTRDFFQAIRGSVTAKTRRFFWLNIRSFYRKIRTHKI